MARFRPSLDRLNQLVEPLDETEVFVAKALSRLDDGWTVYVAPRVGLDRPSFVAVHDQLGVCAFEVVDWRPGDHRATDDGGIEVRDNLGNWHRSAEHPRYTANRYRSTIYDQYFALPNDAGEPNEAVRAVVVLPRFHDAPAVDLLSHPSVPDAERRIAVWGGEGVAARFDEVVRGGGCAHPRPESMLRLRQHLVASEVASPPDPPTALSPGARNIVQNPSGAHVRRVRGAAGSGKSFGLAARAARLAAEGKDVLVLSFNVTLANYLRTMVTARCHEYGANPTRVSCTNFHSFCTRVVQDAEHMGIEMTAPRGAAWPAAIFAKAQQAFAAGFTRRYDAVLVDEGQDFTLDWWNMLRTHVVPPDGEMLLVADPTQDLYERGAWTDDGSMLGSGFSGPWTELEGTYRMPTDIIPLAEQFAIAHLDGDRLAPQVAAEHAGVAGMLDNSVRHWINVDRVGDVGIEIGREVVRLLRDNPSLTPRDVVFLCEYHHDGVAAAGQIEAAGYPVHHIFSRNPDEPRRRRKYRFWPDGDGVKGSTVHSFKGWETPAVVLGIGMEPRSKRLAYVAMTRVKANEDGPSFVSVVNANKRIGEFKTKFEAWSAPQAGLRIS